MRKFVVTAAVVVVLTVGGFVLNYTMTSASRQQEQINHSTDLWHKILNY